MVEYNAESSFQTAFRQFHKALLTLYTNAELILRVSLH